MTYGEFERYGRSNILQMLGMTISKNNHDYVYLGVPIDALDLEEEEQ